VLCIDLRGRPTIWLRPKLGIDCGGWVVWLSIVVFAHVVLKGVGLGCSHSHALPHFIETVSGWSTVFWIGTDVKELARLFWLSIRVWLWCSSLCCWGPLFRGSVLVFTLFPDWRDHTWLCDWNYYTRFYDWNYYTRFCDWNYYTRFCWCNNYSLHRRWFAFSRVCWSIYWIFFNDFASDGCGDDCSLHRIRCYWWRLNRNFYRNSFGFGRRIWLCSWSRRNRLILNYIFSRSIWA